MQSKAKPWNKGVKRKMRRIGPWISVPEDFVANMQMAYDADCESGSHWLSNEKADLLNREFPSVMAMARIIEGERDALKKQLRQLTKNRKRQKYGKERRQKE